MIATVPLSQIIEKVHVKLRDLNAKEGLEAFGVSNTSGITRTAHRKSENLSEYLVIEPGSFAYNPYRVNVGSIGLTPADIRGVVSPAYIVFRVKDQKWIPEVLLDYLKSAKGIEQINMLTRGTVRKALRFDDLCKIAVPALSHDRQLEIVRRKDSVDGHYASLLAENSYQQTLISQAKKAILEDAIRGKLTSNWRTHNLDGETASQLLDRIKVEKAKLVAAKVFRAEKPLAAISVGEAPFDIPKSWVWSRLGDVAKVWNGFAFSSQDFGAEGIPVIRIGDLIGGDVVTVDSPRVPRAIARGLAKHFWIPKGALLISMSGTIGRTAINNLEEELLLNQRVGRIEVFGNNVGYVKLFLDCIIEENIEIAYGAAQLNLSTEQIYETMLPLPPLAEQAAIVDRVEKLLATCQALEEETESARLNARELVRAISDEAFS
jgi:type I restriction enzyme S subunit